ncbi:MAG: sigma-70 family RNA polymerase sigma factor [Candidatus Latescibacteria bacterium]|jgi:RNA polymerase sigma factor (sigma-70 family)|nr:sigma-70 family RNA polymerase sigma factor [Candidatus Latescibacterota bacterium]
MEHFETLVLRAQSGIMSLEQRQEAFSELVRRFQALIYHRAQETLNDPHWAQDIVQETFLSAWINLERLQHPRAFPSWLKRILNTQCHRALRRIHPEVGALDDDHPSNAETPDTAFEMQNLRQRIIDAIADLPDHERLITELFYLEGYSQRDISRLTDVPVRTVKSRLYSSRQRLRETLEDLERDHFENRYHSGFLSSSTRPDQITNCLQSVLETERVRCLVARTIPVPALVTVQQHAEPIMLPVTEISGAIAPTPATIY